MSHTPTADTLTPEKSARPSLAVLIPTLNRPHDLRVTVETLLRQSVLPRELIIVDQSRTDESELAVRALLEESPQGPAITLQYRRDPGINSLAIARNVALSMSHSEIILFLDDDVELEDDFVERLLDGYVEDPLLGGISGIITNYKPGAWSHRLWQAIFVHGPFRDDRQSIYHRAEELRHSGRIPVTRFGGGLMSFRARVIAGVQFDENLRGSSEGEDVDFCMHLPPGTRLAIDPRARLVHKASPLGRRTEHWSAAVVRGTSYLYHRNWRSSHLAFGWLMTGFASIALLATLKQRSSRPWDDFVGAYRYGRSVGLASK
jgi:glycosyltransferase involved in cell wall biosynthesis